MSRIGSCHRQAKHHDGIRSDQQRSSCFIRHRSQTMCTPCLGLGELVGADHPRVKVRLDLDVLLVNDAADDSMKCSMRWMRRSHWAYHPIDRGTLESESLQMTAMKNFPCKTEELSCRECDANLEVRHLVRHGSARTSPTWHATIDKI